MNEPTPHEAGPLPVSPHSEAHEAAVIRNRRLMRREYSKNYGHEPVIFVNQCVTKGCQNPAAVRIGMDGEGSQLLCHEHAGAWTPSAPTLPSDLTNYAKGFLHGFLLTLGIVLGVTAFLLFKVL